MSRSHAARASRRPAPLRGWKALVSVLAVAAAACTPRPTPIPLSRLKSHIEAGEVRSVVIGPRSIVAVPTEEARAAGAPEKWTSTALEDPSLIPLLDSQGVTYEGEGSSASPLHALLILLGVGGLAGGLGLIYRRGGFATPAGVGGVDAHDARDEQRRVRYADVMGIDEVKEELEEVVAFLKDPERFARVGARAPKGVLLVGPPGTGKTLLARATAGEAGVPFYSVSGSAFVEMFVGVGARRVRQLFHKARAHAPSIVFIDEIDAVGKGRGHGGPGSNEEREQALNQLLVEMDGFEAGEGIVVMAATNRPEILDAALLRPGRFDRRVRVNVPDRAGRRAILGVHARTVRLAPSVDLDSVAAGTPGFAGADLANLVNEAALLAARDAHDEVLPGHFDAAVDRVLAGPERKGSFLTEKERRIVAVHEAGHALVAERRPTADPVRKISIVPRAIGALGFTQQLPDDRSLLQRDELIDRLCVLMAGRAAEDLVFGQVSTGASNDLERASALARRMVCELGMSDALGPVRYGGAGRGPFVDGPEGTSGAPSEATAAEIDREVRLLVEEQARAARAILHADRAALGALSDALLREETLEQDAFREILLRHGDCNS